MISKGGGKDLYNIPMPNEMESSNEHWIDKKLPWYVTVFDFFKEHVKIEELILIGLILLLIEESIEDEFLLIMLIYILLF